ncbi:MAG: endo-1,3-alpha-glucanase family glycosylhydrolase [Spirochaetota bacterium]
MKRSTSFPVFIILTAMIASMLAAEVRTGTEDLPIDNFDAYVGALPPHPWTRLGKIESGVDVSLRTNGESPFINNLVTGKGMVVSDASASAGPGAGIGTAFTPPPAGDLYLGFDFRYRTNATDKGLDQCCEFKDAAGKGLSIFFGDGDSLSLSSGGERTRLFALTPGTWYHFAVLITTNDGTIITLTDFPAKRVQSNTSFAASFLAYSQLNFLSAGSRERTGEWTVDNVMIAGRVDAPRTAWWPFKQAPIETLTRTKRKVFTYYYPIFTAGMSDEDPALHWYSRTVLNPSANNKKDRIDAGTELLLRPLPRTPLRGFGTNKTEMLIVAMMEEVRLARAQGNDGFLLDFNSAPTAAGGGTTFSMRSFCMLDAASRVDPSFKIVPAVYSPAKKSGINGESDEGVDPIAYARSPYVKRIIEHPATMKLSDGRTVFSMWLTERHSTNWWHRAMTELSNLGMPIALVAQFNSYIQITNFSPLCYGMAHWGPRSPGAFDWVSRVRDLTTVAVFPIAAQDVRTRGCWLFEACNSEALRSYWNSAINDNADWAFINTWSDYSEQPMEPSTAIGFGPYDMNAYYIQWFKTGEQPKITRDVLHYVYRRHHTDIDPGKGVKWTFRGREAENSIEVVGFLTAPGRLRITINGTMQETNSDAGVTSFKVPMPVKTAFVPQFTLLRSGVPVVDGKGRYAVVDAVEYPNLVYCYGVLADTK